MRLPSVTNPPFCIPSLVIALELLTVGGGSGARSHIPSATTITNKAAATSTHFLLPTRGTGSAVAIAAGPLWVASADECAFNEPDELAMPCVPLSAIGGPEDVVRLLPESNSRFRRLRSARISEATW